MTATNDNGSWLPLRKKRDLMDWIDKFSYKTIFVLWLANACLFALIYTLLSYSPGNGPTSIDSFSLEGRLLNSLYYSVITATNTGYGDIVPQGLSRAFAALESFGGLFLFALFMARLVSRYQDVAIRQMHKISLEGISHAVREDLYIVRRDFEHILHVAKTSHALGEQEWNRLSIAYKQISNLLHEIPNFYDYQHHLYVIDLRREELLVEAFHRTLHRVNNLLDTLQRENIDWISHEESLAQLREVLNSVDTFVVLWRDRSDPKKGIQFEEILHVAHGIRARIRDAMPMGQKQSNPSKTRSHSKSRKKKS